MIEYRGMFYDMNTELATVVELCYLIGDFYFKSMKFAQTQEHIRNCLAFLIGFGLLPSRRRCPSVQLGDVSVLDTYVTLVAAEGIRLEEVPLFGDRWSLALVFNAWATLALSTSGRIDALLNLVCY